MPYPPLPTPRAVVLLLLLSGCAAAPEGPQNTVQVPPERLASAGARASLQIQRRGELLRELDTTRYVRCVADALIQAIPAAPADWEVVVMRDETPDAWALAGRRLGVTKALLRVTGNQDRLAAVLAHGIAHELLGHTGAHVTPSVAASLEGDAALSNEAIAAIGGASQVGAGFAYSASEEAAADGRALALMGAAGFDPAAASLAWAQLQAYRVREGTSGERPPPMLLVHPIDRSRIQAMHTPAAAVTTAFDAARLSGRRPDCGTLEESER